MSLFIVKGGLGILDLHRFSRALRIKWEWYRWTEPDRPWFGSETPLSETDMQFFIASTKVIVGNDRTAEFWNSSWLDGQAPRDIAPNLYKQDDNWTRGLWRMTTATTEMAEFIHIWELLQNITLTDLPDSIAWRWIADGNYNAKFAYLAQFNGSYYSFQAKHIWKAQVEGKHRFFAWLPLQKKILTADKLMVRNWPCNPICPLCNNEVETATHICLHCPFALLVWSKVAT